MKVTLNEIKKNLQGTNNGEDEAENQINDLEHRKEKAFNQNSRKKKEFKKRRRSLESSGTTLYIRTSES